MIKFSCKKCGQKLNVDDKHAGKRVKCPKCGSVGVVPDNSDKIKFHCENCGQRISVPQIHAGKKGKCPECGSNVEVPSETIPAESAGPSASIPPRADEDLYEEPPEAPEESVSVNHRLILLISGAAVVVVVGLIILVTVILPSGPQPVEEPESRRDGQEVADTDSRPQSVTSDAQPTAEQSRDMRQSNQDTDSRRKREVDPKTKFMVLLGIFCPACIVFHYFIHYFRRKCPACGKRWGLRRTTWFYFCWFPDDSMYEYKCKGCGHIEWKIHWWLRGP